VLEVVEGVRVSGSCVGRQASLAGRTPRGDCGASRGVAGRCDRRNWAVSHTSARNKSLWWWDRL